MKYGSAGCAAYRDYRSTSMLEKLARAVGHGVALASLTLTAGCSDGQRPARDPAPRDASTMLDGSRHGDPSAHDASRADGATGGDAARGDGSQGPPLEPYARTMLGCWGEDYDGGGQCCVEAHCYTPDSGVDCAAAGLVGSRELSGYPPGSGECSCWLGPGASASIAGPFAPNPEDTPQTAGECCYVLGVVGCTGRPLTVDGRAVVAALALRRDWAPFA